jgi:hypothetical protein
MAKAGNLAKNNALSEIGEHFLEKCPDHLKPEDWCSMILLKHWYAPRSTRCNLRIKTPKERNDLGDLGIDGKFLRNVVAKEQPTRYQILKDSRLYLHPDPPEKPKSQVTSYFSAFNRAAKPCIN